MAKNKTLTYPKIRVKSCFSSLLCKIFSQKICVFGSQNKNIDTVKFIYGGMQLKCSSVLGVCRIEEFVPTGIREELCFHNNPLVGSNLLQATLYF